MHESTYLTQKEIEVPSATGPVTASLKVPGSKSITQRALITAFLAKGTSLLMDPLDSEDISLLSDSLMKLGAQIHADGNQLSVRGTGGSIVDGGLSDSVPMQLYMGNNGTGIRFLASIAGLGRGWYRLYGTERMAERPIQPLLDALKQWGAEALSERNSGCPPVLIQARGLKGGHCLLKAKKSSQYLSSLLLAGPYCAEQAQIELEGLVSRPYVDLTIAVMKAFGIEPEEKDNTFTVPKGSYRNIEYQVEGDASSASYFFAAAAITGGEVTIENLPSDSLQGDSAFVDLLAKMGCDIVKTATSTTVKGPADGVLKAIETDMSKWPDMVPTLAVVAAFATGTTEIKNVAHLRIKETDRLKAVATELSKMGGSVRELPDGLVIEGGHQLRPTIINTYDDHRIAMCFAVAGLRVPGLVIQDPACVAKSFPDFWDRWHSMLEKA